MKYIGVGHPECKLHHAIVILGVGQSKVLTCREKIKREGRGKGMAANAWGDHDTRSQSQSDSDLENCGKGKEWLYGHVVS